MSDEVKGRGPIGELIAQVFERYEKEKLKRKVERANLEDSRKNDDKYFTEEK